MPQRMTQIGTNELISRVLFIYIHTWLQEERQVMRIDETLLHSQNVIKFRITKYQYFNSHIAALWRSDIVSVIGTIEIMAFGNKILPFLD